MSELKQKPRIVMEREHGIMLNERRFHLTVDVVHRIPENSIHFYFWRGRMNKHDLAQLKCLTPAMEKVARKLLALPGVESIEIDHYEVKIHKGDAFDWDPFIPKILNLLITLYPKTPEIVEVQSGWRREISMPKDPSAPAPKRQIQRSKN